MTLEIHTAPPIMSVYSMPEPMGVVLVCPCRWAKVYEETEVPVITILEDGNAHKQEAHRPMERNAQE